MTDKKVSASKPTSYECAKQLKEIIAESNMAPIISMVIYELLISIRSGSVPMDSSIYEYIERNFADKIVLADPSLKSVVHQKAKAYLIILLEIVSQAKLLSGVSLDMLPVKQITEANVSVQMSKEGLSLMRRGVDFLLKVDAIRSDRLLNSALVTALTEATMSEVEFILSKYRRKKKTPDIKNDDVIVIDKVQA